MKNAAVYKILCTADGRAYVGSSGGARRRLWYHRWMLRRGSHDNSALQRAWDKHGEAAFVFEIIEVVDVLDHLLEREQVWIDRLRCAVPRYGYNVCQVAGTRRGVPQPPSVAEKMRAFHLGKPKSAEHRAKIGAAHKGLVKSSAHRDKLRQAAIRQFSSQEARDHASEISIKGWRDPERLVAAARHAEKTLLRPEVQEKKRVAVIASNIRRADAAGRKPKVSCYVRKPLELHLKTGPKKGTPRPEKRNFTPKVIRAIRTERAEGASYLSLSRKYDSDNSTIFNIVKRKTYADIE